MYCPACHKSDLSLILFIIVKIGLDDPEPLYLQQTMDLFTTRWSLGMIGGKQCRALYFVGNLGDKLVYLDPHIVQKASTVKSSLFEQDLYKSYFCDKFQTLDKKEIGTSIGLGFYLKNLAEFDQFCSKINELQEQYKSEFMLYFERTNENYLKAISQVQQAETVNEDGFIILG